MNRKLMFSLALVLLAIIVLFLLPSDEKKIRHNLELLAEYSSSSPGEAGVAELQKAALVAKQCSDPCRVHIESLDIARNFNKKELREHVILMKRSLPAVTFGFTDTRVELTTDERAEVVTTLALSGELADERFSDAYELNIIALKQDGEWLFSDFTVVEFMER
ncbi:MAG: hypothetical protein ABFR63_00620 [Thermodesulfobacteriota bacterium]